MQKPHLAAACSGLTPVWEASRVPKDQARTRLYLVCSPLGTVGKTTTARLLLEHALGNLRSAQGFDTNYSDPELRRLFPLATMAVDLSSTRGQMDLFDRLVVNDGAPKIVDMWHATYDLFWSQADNLGFFHEAYAQGVDVVVFVQADRKDRFVQELLRLPVGRPGLNLVLVHNESLLSPPLSEKGRVAIVGAKRLLMVPPFDAATRRMLDEPGTAASIFLRAPPNEEPGSLARRQLLRRVFDQLTFLELSMTKAA